MAFMLRLFTRRSCGGYLHDVHVEVIYTAFMLRLLDGITHDDGCLICYRYHYRGNWISILNDRYAF